MKRLFKFFLLCLLLLGPAMCAWSQGTAFTYQGRLMDNGSPASGDYDLSFSIFDDPTAGNQVGDSLTNAPTSVSNGLFTVILDFGAGVFDGSQRWLEIAVSEAGADDFAVLTPRQPLTPTPYAIRAQAADTAATAADVSPGTVVRSINTLKDDVTFLAGSNVTITPVGNALTIAAAGGGGNGIWSVNNNNAYYTAGNVGIGSSTPNHRLRLSGGPFWTSSFWGGALELDNASAIGWRGNAAGNRFGIGQTTGGLHVFATASDPGNTANPANYLMTFDDLGNIGIGTTAPTTRLEVNGATRITAGGSGGEVRFHTPAGESGMSIFGVNRADVRFDGTSLKLLAGPATGAPGSLNGIAVNTNGNVGIGTTTPGAKLQVASSGDGINAYSTAVGGTGVYGAAYGSNGEGVHGASSGNGAAVNGTSTGGGTGVYGSSASGYAGYFAGPVLTSGRISANAGISATSSGSPAGSFLGNVSVSGNVTVSGSVTKSSGAFKIDHPLDPANKYLYHSFVESPDMLNIYNGNIALDDKGEAIVLLPEWFGSLNKDFRYQLTAIGAPGPGLYIAEETAGNQFKIAGGKPGAKVSWQVTGVRQDAFANAHRIPLEEEKTGSERGTYLHPELFGQPSEESLAKNQH
jgi:hypothetical protein